MNKLSIVIPFLNEGIEVEYTLNSICDTADCDIDLILVNDASNDSFDYRQIAEKYGATYIEHTQRLGSGPAKQTGINACCTPFFLVIDAHMRFYKNDWCQTIINALEEDARAIYCCCCKVWRYNTKEEAPINNLRYAAYIHFFQPEERNIIEPKWIRDNLWDEQPIVDVPCVLGACYAATKEYWNYLKGYEGLQLYGCEEAYISMKAWLEGGRCRLLKSIEIGHLFKDIFLFNMERNELFYNKLLIIETLFPEKYVRKYIRALKSMNYVEYVHAKELFDMNCEQIFSLKSYYKDIFTVEIDDFLKFNESFIR